jgi:ParB-like chromosome segregation protein Spo0J
MHIGKEKTETVCLELIAPGLLRPTEEYNPDAAAKLANEIRLFGYWTRPVLVHRESLAILDGHHRRRAAITLGLKKIPCDLVCYGDPRVILKGWREDIIPTPEIVLKAAESGCLLPYKTTRHILSTPSPLLHIPLDALY